MASFRAADLLGRALILFGALLCLPACAQVTDVTPRSDAQSLRCLVKPAKAPTFPERNDMDRSWGAMRVLLRFDKPDAKPRVEVLVNTARQDMQDRVHDYLADYRLPCLLPEDGTVSAVQEFHFSNSLLAPLPFDEKPYVRDADFCIVMPREAMEGWTSYRRELEHMVVEANFTGDGTQPPTVKVLYSTGDRIMERTVIDYVQSYRMPCRTAGAKPRAMQQIFTFRPAGAQALTFKQEGFSLVEFLGMTAGIRDLEADFDFKTMGCPFKVNYTVRAPGMSNTAQALGPKDPNRAHFLKWLAERNLSFKNERQARMLFGNSLQINVPCINLRLGPEAPAGAS